MSDSNLEGRVRILEQTVEGHSDKLKDIRETSTRIEHSMAENDVKIAGIQSDMRSYAIQYGKSIKTLQDAVTALRELTSELKQESKLQEKSIELVIDQMKHLNISVNSVSSTINKFIYVATGVGVTVVLITSGTLTTFLETFGG
jgi:methyl-accepting chemotaxis protein